MGESLSSFAAIPFFPEVGSFRCDTSRVEYGSRTTLGLRALETL
jgi:hypothetical protein